MEDNEVMQEEQVEEQQTTPEEQVDPWDDDWSEFETESFSVDEEEPSPQTDEPEAEEELPAEETAPEQEPTPEPQRFKLTHLGKEQEVTLEEITALAQKGMNYDHTKGKLDSLNDFVKRMAAGNNQSVEDFMTLTAARMLMAEESKNGNRLSETEALLRVQREMYAPQSEPERQDKPEAQSDADAFKNRMLTQFMDAYPGVKGDDIPKEVWDEGFKTGDLAGAYGRYENRLLRKEIETLKQNEKNRARSTGSRKSAGAANGKDPFDALWYDGT